jgi:hypothetical protein
MYRQDLNSRASYAAKPADHCGAAGLIFNFLLDND